MHSLSVRTNSNVIQINRIIALVSVKTKKNDIAKRLNIRK